MIESGGSAPYAPASAVIDVIHAYRDRPVPTPIDTDVLERIGVMATLAPRTLQALRLLDLIDEGGNPTTALQDLRKAGSEDYRDRLAEVVRAAYAEIFTYRDPAVDDVSKIEDQFRSLKPVSMRPRMVRLFLGLCEEAGIIESAPRVKKTGGTTSRASGGAKRGRATVKNTPQGATPLPATAAAGPLAPRPTDEVAGSDHLAIRGLLLTLPPVGSVFPDARRKEWSDAVLAAFNLIYVRPPEDSKARVTLTPSTGGGESS